jgi:hypothetical protein
MYKSGTRSNRLTIRIPARLKAALEHEARQDRRSMADIAILALEAAVAKKKEVMPKVTVTGSRVKAKLTPAENKLGRDLRNFTIVPIIGAANRRRAGGAAMLVRKDAAVTTPRKKKVK